MDQAYRAVNELMGVKRT